MAETTKSASWWQMDDDSVIPCAMLEEIGLDSEEKQKAALGDKAQRHEIRMKRALGEHRMQIQQRCLNADLQYDPTREPSARFAVLVDGWSMPGKVTEDAYLNLPLAVAAFIDNALMAHMMPSAFANKDFLAALKKSQANSAAESESVS